MGSRAVVRLVAAVVVVVATGCGLGAVGLLEVTPTTGDGAAAGEGADGAEGTGPDDANATADGNDDGATTTCVADLAVDPANCGACGHDCGGGTCIAGRCAPIAFVTEPAGQVVRAVAADATHVYWSNTSTNAVYRVGVDGAGREEILSTGATQLAVDPGHLYYTGGGLHRIDLATRKTQMLAATGTACIGLDPDGVHVYAIGPADTVMRMDRDGGPTETVLGPSDGVSKPWGIAATSSHWYWSEGLHLEPDGSIFRRARPSGPTTPVLLHQANPNCLTFGDDGRLYWPNADEGAIHRSDPSGSGDETLATGQDTPTQVAMNAKFFYWNNGNKLMRLAR